MAVNPYFTQLHRGPTPRSSLGLRLTPNCLCVCVCVIFSSVDDAIERRDGMRYGDMCLRVERGGERRGGRGGGDGGSYGPPRRCVESPAVKPQP